MSVENSKLGLVLGSGASRGLAHIGVIKVLEKYDVKIGSVTGTSIGALIGGLYASGMTGKQMEEIACNTDWRTVAKVFLPTLFRNTSFAGKYLKEFITALVGDTDFKDLNIPFACVTTDLLSGNEIIIDKGSLSEAILASVSLPGLFKPVQTNGRLLVDGGLVNPLPVNLAKYLGSDKTISVNVTPPMDRPMKKLKVKSNQRSSFFKFAGNSKILSDRLSLYFKIAENFKEEKFLFFDPGRPKKGMKVPSLMETATQAVVIMQNQIIRLNLAESPTNILIEPDVSQFQLLDFSDAKKIIKQGEIETEKHIRKIIKIIEKVDKLRI
ncbi:MAG: patatin-like phospholipase family protein [Calditrichaceae bacterium]